MKRMKLKRFLVLFMLIIVTSISSISIGYSTIVSDNNNSDSLNIIMSDTLLKDSVYCENDSILKDMIKDSIITAAQDYVYTKVPKANKTIVKEIVDNALEYNIDLCFVLAQTELETKYGTLGIGRPTSKYSLFGVYTKYDNYSHAINKYFKLITTSYLVNGKTEQHLLKNYVNVRGKRYAEGHNYEVHLTKTYKNICKVTNLKELQQHYSII